LDWSRAKTILIVFLFVVNAFLFGTYMAKENESRKDMIRLRDEVVSVLSGQGISVSEDVVPVEEVKIRHATVKVSEDTKKLAEKLFGEADETVNADMTVYSAENGNIMFAGDAFSFVYEAGEMIMSREEAVYFAKSIAGKLGISHSGAEITAEPTVGGYIVKIPQVFGGVPLFGADIELNISNSGNILGNGKFIAKGRLIRAEGKTMSTPSLLLEFADEARKAADGAVKIVGLRYGYTAKAPAGGSVYLMPTLEIRTDSGSFYVNMSDGKTVG